MKKANTISVAFYACVECQISKKPHIKNSKILKVITTDISNRHVGSQNKLSATFTKTVNEKVDFI
jgi:hypothetical protein